MDSTNTVARAFELARGGTCHFVSDIRQQLKTEGFDQIEAHMRSGSLRKQLTGAMKIPD